MKFSEDTLTILKNFATIYDGLAFKKGNSLKTMDTGKIVFAAATISEEIPHDFYIGKLNTFLSVLSLENDIPNLEIDDKNVYVVGNKGRSKITYRQCTPDNLLDTNKSINITPENTKIKFDLSEEDFKWVMRSATILQNPHILVVGDGSHVYLRTTNVHDNSVHSDSLDLGEFPAPQNTVRVVFKTENWKMIPGPYEVCVSSKAVSSFEHKDRKLKYWIAVEAN